MEDKKFKRRRFLAVSGSVTFLGISGCLGGSQNPSDGQQQSNGDEDWSDIDEFYFEGRVSGWTGVEPEIIEGEENPTLILYEGNEYDFRWINKDGVIHNFEIRDEEGNVVEDYATSDVSTEDEEEVLESVEASSDMARYVCQYHLGSQSGDIEIRSP